MDVFNEPKFLHRSLYPVRDARRDHVHLHKSLVNFLATYGYWPTKYELVERMKANLAAVTFGLFNLRRAGLVYKQRRKGARPYFQLSPRGWQALGLKPIEPWIRRPKRLETQIAHMITLKLADLEDAQRLLNEREGTPLKRDGRRSPYKTQHHIDKATDVS